MTTIPNAELAYEIENSEDPTLGPIKTILFHGRIVSETGPIVKEAVKPLIPLGGHIRLDLTDVSYMDSSGLGTLVALKLSAVNEGYCVLELVNLSPRLKELLSLSNLGQLFGS